MGISVVTQALEVMCRRVFVYYPTIASEFRVPIKSRGSTTTYLTSAPTLSPRHRQHHELSLQQRLYL
jgi:hypothetical protein